MFAFHRWNRRIVIKQVKHYVTMPLQQPELDWRDLLKEAHDHVRATLGGRVLTPADEMVRMGREQRDAEQLGWR